MTRAGMRFVYLRLLWRWSPRPHSPRVMNEGYETCGQAIHSKTDRQGPAIQLCLWTR